MPHRPTVKIISQDSVSITLSEVMMSSTISSASSTSSSSSSDVEIPAPAELREAWLSTFEIPLFAVDIEYKLKQGNLVFFRNGRRLNAPKDMRHNILQKLADEICKYTVYPNKDQLFEVVQALTKKHPCLAEPGSSTGCLGWKNKLFWKMGNVRSKLHKLGMPEVAVNSRGRRNQREDGEPPTRCIRKARRCETNFLPNFPQDQDGSALEYHRQRLQTEVMKRTPDAVLINQLMDSTFALRRKEIVEEQPPVKRMLERWPALFRKQVP